MSMNGSRRGFLISTLGSLSALMVGCQTSSSNLNLPETTWPVHTRGQVPLPGIPSPNKNEPTPLTPPPTGSGTASSPYPRSVWTRATPIMRDINPMNGVSRITIHHTGMPQPVTVVSRNESAEYLEMLRKSHVSKGWADIGYHYIIDRAGRVWEGRSARYQGAHVKDTNEHNLGIMVLGNFEQQAPTEAQIQSLVATVRHFRSVNRVPVSQVRTHQELRPTACPGRALQPKVVSIRNNGYFA